MIVPPCASTIARAIASPRPLPPAVASAAAVDAMEAFEDGLELVGGDARTGVGDRDRQPAAVFGASRDADRVARLGVGYRVADEVAQNLGQPVGVGVQRAGDRLELEVSFAVEREIAAEILEVVVEVDRMRLDQPPSLGARERQHVTDEPVELVEASEQRRGALVPLVLVVLAVEQLDLGADHRQRRPQLV